MGAIARVHRRHLTDSQRAMIAAELATLTVGRPVMAPDGVINSPTYSEVKELMQASLASIGRARCVSLIHLNQRV